jgi:hypothetical protein
MPLVMNASSQEQQVRVHGAWFTFSPGQIKDMHEDKVFFLTSTCSYLGFVGLPESLSDIDFKNSEAGQKLLAEAKQKGIANRVAFLESLKRNEIVSLQRDLDKANQKYDARLEMDPAMLPQLEELATYKIKKQDEAQKKLDRIKEIEAQLED